MTAVATRRMYRSVLEPRTGSIELGRLCRVDGSPMCDDRLLMRTYAELTENGRRTLQQDAQWILPPILQEPSSSAVEEACAIPHAVSQYHDVRASNLEFESCCT